MNMLDERTDDERTVHTGSRHTAPVLRATIAIGTIVALVASLGAPFKWY